MEQKKTSLFYRILYKIVYAAYPKITSEGMEHLPKEPAIYVGNHAKMNGPLACEFHFPVPRYTWCASQMMDAREVPAYAFQDFWSGKPKYTHWFYRILSHLITPLAVCIFNNAYTIPVYHDTRVITTFKTTLKKLQEGMSIVIFPEHAVDHNHIICEFQDRFIDIAKLYYKKTGIELPFVPMYLAPNLKKLYFGEPIRFCATNSMEEERNRIRDYLMEEITKIACSCPPHTVIPYKNIPKRNYPMNIPKEAVK